MTRGIKGFSEEAVTDLLRNPESRRQMVTRASLYAACHCWENRKSDYLALVDHLLESE